MSSTISVVIPSLNSAFVDRTVAAIKDQKSACDKLQIIVVGLDEAGRVVQDDMVRFISTGRPVCAAAARNIGLRAARSDIILFTDADCLPAPDWLQAHLDSHRSGKKVVGGSVTFTIDNYWTTADNVSMFHEFTPSTPAGYRSYLPTLNLSVAREVVEKVGAFDESFPGASGEDIDWTIRIRRQGYALYFEPHAKVVHCPSRQTLSSVLGHWWRSGQSMVRVRLRYPEVFGTPSFVRSPFWLVVLSPLISIVTSLRIFWSDRWTRQYLATLPVVLLTKVVWCLGAARQVRRLGNHQPQ